MNSYIMLFSTAERSYISVNLSFQGIKVKRLDIIVYFKVSMNTYFSYELDFCIIY